MTDPKINYVGPLPQLTGPRHSRRNLAAPLAFGLVVVLPTLIAAVYLLFIATPRYVAEARFMVRQAEEKPAAAGLGAALGSVGISGGTNDAHAVLEYFESADGLRDLQTRVDVRRMYARPGVDAFSKLPKPFSDSSEETFRKQFLKYLTIGYDSQTGLSTLRVQAFTAQDAQRIANAMLEGGEGLVNRLNDRSATDAVRDAERQVSEAQTRLINAQTRLTEFRNREGLIDPATTAKAGSELIGELTVSVANLRAERAQVAADAPNSPQLPFLDSRIRAFERQIAAERQKIVGDAGSLAPKISAYESLMTEREFAEKLVATSAAALNSAQIEARRQRLYLDRVVNPIATDKATQPRRMRGILTVLISTLLIYALGWMVWAGIRESRVEAE
ncbi:chain-length determining protein [Brevundimonas sp. VNH65]|uniref:chain-length determining protein n=1 Tax=Brevundimonas sp. VNH65 TaxID=3400917 RepID=UPI003C07C491